MPVLRSPPPKLSEITNIYIDESSQTKHRYLVLGGVILSAVDVERFHSVHQAARCPDLPHGELKWTKVSRSKLAAYKRVVDAFFDGGSEFEICDFHSAVIDLHKVNDKRFNDGSREMGFSKEIYQLLMKFRRLYRDSLFHVYPDRRSTPQTTEELRLILNRGSVKQGDTRPWPFRRVHFRDSHDEPALQVTDLLIGAIAFKMNGHADAKDASPAKSELCEHILERAKVKEVTRDTAISGRFTIWHRVLR